MKLPKCSECYLSSWSKISLNSYLSLQSASFRLLHPSSLSDADDLASFAHRYAPQVLEKTPQDELMTFMLVFLSTPYMKNPYLKGQFVEVSRSSFIQLFLACRAYDRNCDSDHVLPLSTNLHFSSGMFGRRSKFPRSRTQEPHALSHSRLYRFVIIVLFPVFASSWQVAFRECRTEIEVTGSHTQFYDKFNIRYYITQLFKLVWSNPTHRESLRAESL